MPDFKTFVADAWRDHADDPSGVADRLGDALPLISEDAQIAALAGIAHHVFGEHLGAWHDGLAFFDRLSALPSLAANGTGGAALRCCTAGLLLAARLDDTRAALAPSDRVRASAMAAATLAERDTPRALMLFEEALAQMRSAALPAADPANRALAGTANNLAVALERKPSRTTAERDLMILAAQTARTYWAIAGTWLETERAEYRLAMTWLQAGDAAEAQRHAQACLAIVAANDGAPLERFFAHEALALAEHATGRAAARAHAIAAARRSFEQLDDSDKTWCAETLATLDALTPS